MITSLVFGIISITTGLYEDVYSFPLRLSSICTNQTAGSFNAEPDELFSFWIKLPDRRIENKDFQITTTICNSSLDKIITWKNDFKSSYLRSSSSQGQYYQLGSCRFHQKFRGFLKYSTNGSWIAPYNAHLVIRKIKSFRMPRFEMIALILGIIVLFQGINLMQQNFKCFCEENSSGKKNK